MIAGHLLSPGELVISTQIGPCMWEHFEIDGATVRHDGIMLETTTFNNPYAIALLVGVRVLRPMYTGVSDAVYALLLSSGQIGYSWSVLRRSA